MLALALSGCAGGGARDALKGRAPAGAAYVGHLSMTEPFPDRAPNAFRFRAPAGHVMLVYFGFVSCPDICPTTLSDVRKALRALGDDSSRVDLAFVTVDPQRDTPEVIGPYVRSFVPAGHALRPVTQSELGRVQAAFGATSSVTKKADGEINVSHTAVTYVVDANGKVLVEWPFGTPSADMIHDLRILLPSRKGAPAS